MISFGTADSIAVPRDLSSLRPGNALPKHGQSIPYELTKVLLQNAAPKGDFSQVKNRGKSSLPTTEAPAKEGDDIQDADVKYANRVLDLKASSCGKYFLCVTVESIVIFGSNEDLDWIPVGICARPRFEVDCYRVCSAWKPDLSCVVVSNSLGVAEFYDVVEDFDESGAPIFVANLSSTKLKLGSWNSAENPKVEENRSGRLLDIRYRCAVNSSVDGDCIGLYSVASTWNGMIAGTGRTSIIRVLWTGEIQNNREINLRSRTVYPKLHLEDEIALKNYPDHKILSNQSIGECAIVQLSIGTNQRIGFLSENGACGVVVPKETQNANFSDRHTVYFLHVSGVSSIALHKTRALAAVGLELLHIEIFAVGNQSFEKIRQIRFGKEEFPLVLFDQAKYQALNDASRQHDDDISGSCQVSWCPDGSAYFCAAYRGLGYVLWSISGSHSAAFSSSRTDQTFQLSKNANINGDSCAASFCSDTSFKKSCMSSFAWVADGYNLIIDGQHFDRLLQNKVSSRWRNSDTSLVRLNILKARNLCGAQSVTANAVLVGHKSLFYLDNENFSSNKLVWKHQDYSNLSSSDLFYVNTVSASLNSEWIAICGKRTVGIHNRKANQWTFWENVLERSQTEIALTFWWRNKFVCVVVYSENSLAWELHCFRRDNIVAGFAISKTILTSRPKSVELWYAENVIVVLCAKKILLLSVQENEYTRQSKTFGSKASMTAVTNTSSDRGENAAKAFVVSESTSFRGFQSSEGDVSYIFNSEEPLSILIHLVETVHVNIVDSDAMEILVHLLILPSGATRRPDLPCRVPKCVVLTSHGSVLKVDLDETSTKLIARGVFEIFGQQWQGIDSNDDFVLEPLWYGNQSIGQRTNAGTAVGELDGLDANETSVRQFDTCLQLPSVLLFSIWLQTEEGLTLWLPVLDPDGENLFARCTDPFHEYFPMGILDAHGALVCVGQKVHRLDNMFLPTFEISTLLMPTTSSILIWLARANRFDLVKQIFLQMSVCLPFFHETLDITLHAIMEEDFKNSRVSSSENENLLLPKLVKLLRTQELACIFKEHEYNALIVRCARKMERSRWNIFFSHAADPLQLYNDAIYEGSLKTAAASLVIANHFDPAHAEERLTCLFKQATEKNDKGVLRQISQYSEKH